MGDYWNINWYVESNDKILNHPLFSKYSNTSLGAIDANEVKSDLGSARMSRESAPIVAYLSAILRVKALLAA